LEGRAAIWYDFGVLRLDAALPFKDCAMDNNSTIDFGDPEKEYQQARAGAALFDVSPRGKVEVVGSDAVAFLHNLVSNDIKGLAPGAGCEAFLCTVKAKVIAWAHVFRETPSGKREKLWLDLDPGLSEKVLQHLDHHLISEDVQLADRTGDFTQLHLAGPQAGAVLAGVAGADPGLAPVQHRIVTIEDGRHIPLRRRDALGLPGYDLLCAPDRTTELWRLLTDAGARPAGTQALETLRVEAGTPLYGVDVDENTFAPEVGRTRQAISYAKGCYLGQEPIVMARDRGQVNRTLLGVKLPGGVVPRGSLLYRDGKEVGRVTSSAQSPRLGTAIGLAYVRRGNQEPGTRLEVDAAGERRPAEVAELPFR
jgi:folate-binding protein YgfZ